MPVSSHPDLLIFLDVGAGEGLQEKWLPHISDLHPVFVEPLPRFATELRAKYPDATVVDGGLSNRTGRFPIYVTRGWGCTSLRQVNDDFMKRYAAYPLFEVRETIDVDVTRYDRLVQQGKAPAPEAMKIDVQGMEYEVLEGMGDVLDHVIAIELETHFYEVYKGQKLLSDIVRFLHDRGFYLRRLEPEMAFDGDLVECNAFFTRNRTPENSRKLDMIERVWHLITTTLGAETVALVEQFELAQTQRSGG